MDARPEYPAATVVLPPEAQSASAARRFCAARVADLPEETVETVTLLASEVVTNAVLHAHTEVEVTVTRLGEGVRVDVVDRSALLPAPRGYGETAVTGRGLGLVEMLSSGYGVEAHAGGKTVWFTVGRTPEGTAPAASGSGWEGAVADLGDTADEAREDHVEVVLRRLPLSTYLVLQQQNDALLREHALLQMDVETEDPAAAAHVAAAERAEGRLAAAVSAAAAQRRDDDVIDVIDVPIRVPRSQVRDFEDLRGALQEAVELAAAGRMLCRPSLPEMRAMRSWCLDQVAAAAAGEPTQPWSSPGEIPDDRLALPAPDVDVATMLDPARAMVAADDGNRILAVTPPAARLLGWAPDELVGRRLVTIIPPRLHEAHVAGFTRLLLTGQPTLLGVPVTLPARHRDGREIPVVALITSMPAGDGRLLFVADLTAADAAPGSPGTPDR